MRPAQRPPLPPSKIASRSRALAAAAAEPVASFDPHEAPTRAYSSSTSGLRLAVGREEDAAALLTAPFADEIPTLPEMAAALPAIAPVLADPKPVLADPTPVLADPTPVLADPKPVLADPTPEAAPDDPIAENGEFFEAPPRYTMTSVAPPPPVVVPRRPPRLVAKLLFAAVGAGVLLLGAVELAVACLR